MTTLQEQLRAVYLDYANTYITLAKFAEHNNITDTDAQIVIDMGRKYHEEYAKLWAKLDE